MNKLYLFLIVSYLIHLTGAQSENVTQTETKWTNEVKLDQDFVLRWSQNESQYLIMEMSAPATGYVAIGFSPDGGMNNSDIVMGWVNDDGKAYIKDLYGVGNTKPKEDPKQNVELIHGVETEGLTTIKFRRRWETCDSLNDLRVDETRVLIWAYNKEDPKLKDDDGVFRPPYHFTTRGAASAEHRVRLPDVYISDNCDGPMVPPMGVAEASLN